MGVGKAQRMGAPMTSGGNVCWRGAWSRPACASWKSRTETGTSTSTSPLRSEQTAARSISPSPALLTDLKQRGLLKDTLVIWGGEFGRTPHAQGNDGRDHNNKAFTMWMAGGGVKGGFAHGLTDDYGYEAVENKVHIHDLHATILHLLGLDHEKLTYRYAGRDFRLTDVKGKVVKEIHGVARGRCPAVFLLDGGGDGDAGHLKGVLRGVRAPLPNRVNRPPMAKWSHRIAVQEPL